MIKVIITRGLPASGKTTWSKDYVKKNPIFKRINRDDLRMMIYNNAWNQKKEVAVLLARKTMIEAFMIAGFNLVLDDTNLIPERMEETKKIINDCAKKNKLEIKIDIKDFTNVPLETCLSRNKKRPNNIRVPDRFIINFYKKYVKPR